MGPQVLRTTRALARETVAVHAYDGLGEDGVVSFLSPVDVDANVVVETRNLRKTDGTVVLTGLTLYVLGTAPYLPGEQDRVELDSDEVPWVVVERTQPRGLRRLRSSVDHVRLLCARDG